MISTEYTNKFNSCQNVFKMLLIMKDSQQSTESWSDVMMPIHLIIQNLYYLIHMKSTQKLIFGFQYVLFLYLGTNNESKNPNAEPGCKKGG